MALKVLQGHKLKANKNSFFSQSKPPVSANTTNPKQGVEKPLRQKWQYLSPKKAISHPQIPSPPHQHNRNDNKQG